ncbi:type II secretion system secretin GspD [Gilvimarinus sp. 2_MG-2023]|uniref:type II secretion system secretin GspD n=1 Tax=Gilvimarinus sp. 2_MG-2023 TaxID=3062666 RepID=UPI0026E339EF|nr:type II secretion system secretin GspD [Gilvimarinus sp. 2_MG-2023]MDO6570938.1 type II secretion system secretin GspD [Gilvimarinus sp. 2_MG-2023]
MLFTIALAIVPMAQADEQTWMVNFKDSDIQEVIKFIAEATEKTIIIDPKVRGQVKVISDKPVNRQELYGLFLSILDVHGFTAVENGKVVRIVPNRDARSLPIPSANSGNSGTDNDAYMTHVIQLENISAAKLLPVLRPLVPQHGHISAYDPSNAIIVTDTRANIDRLMDVVKQIDKAAVISTELVELRYAQAEAIVKVIQQLEKPDAQRGNASAPVTVVADTRINGVLINGDDMQRQRIKELIRRLDRPQITNSNVRVVYLKYAKAEQVAQVLTGVLQNMQKIESDGAKSSNSQMSASVQADEDTNAILITADGDTLQSLMVLVESLDIRRAQVLVEAIIVELSSSDAAELGIEWMYRDESAGFGSSVNDAANDLGLIGGVAQGAFDDSDSGLLNLAQGLAGIPGQVFGIGHLGNSTDMLAVLKLLKANGATNILSTPSLLTTDNHEAEISVGKNVPFVTGSYTSTGSGSSNPTNPFNTVERKDVGILLKVTPHVNDGDTVVMDISQEISSVDDSAAQSNGIVTNQRKIDTQVMAASGEIVVLGGLIQDDVSTFERKVPILGDIPIIGNLFKSQSKNTSKTNLMVFIRASVVPDDEMLLGATAEKYRHIRESLLDQRDTTNLITSPDDIPMLPEWEEQLRKVQRRYESEESDPEPAPVPEAEAGE